MNHSNDDLLSGIELSDLELARVIGGRTLQLHVDNPGQTPLSLWARVRRFVFAEPPVRQPGLDVLDARGQQLPR